MHEQSHDRRIDHDLGGSTHNRPRDPEPGRGGRTPHRHARTVDRAIEDGLTLLRADTLRGVPQDLTRDTFGAYGRRWLEGHPVSNGSRPYIQRVLDAMDPYIGSVRLADLRPTDLAAAYRGLEKGAKQIPSSKRRDPGLAPSTAARNSAISPSSLPTSSGTRTRHCCSRPVSR